MKSNGKLQSSFSLIMYNTEYLYCWWSMNHERLIFYTRFILAKTFVIGGLLQEVYYNIHRRHRKVTVFSTSCLQFHLVAHRSEALIGWALRWGGRDVIHYGLRWEEGLFDSTLLLSLTICSIRVHCAVFSCYLHFFVSNGCLQAGSHSPWRELLEPGESLLWLVRRGPERNRVSRGKERRSSFKRFVYNLFCPALWMRVVNLLSYVYSQISYNVRFVFERAFTLSKLSNVITMPALCCYCLYWYFCVFKWEKSNRKIKMTFRRLCIPSTAPPLTWRVYALNQLAVGLPFTDGLRAGPTSCERAIQDVILFTCSISQSGMRKVLFLRHYNYAFWLYIYK